MFKQLKKHYAQHDKAQLLNRRAELEEEMQFARAGKRPWRCEHWLTSEETAECEKHGKYTRLVLKGPDVRGETIKRVSGCPTCIANELDQVQEALRILKVHELLDRAGIARRFQDCEFENYQAVNADAQRNLEACRRYVSSWEKCLAAGTSMIMIGNCGTGKNHLAVSMAKNIIRHHLATVEITDVMRLTRAVKNTWRHNSERTEDEVIDHFVSLDLLIIDEVGVQFGTPTEITILQEIINARYESVLPTILISNLTFDQLKESIGERIVDRVTDGGRNCLVFGWESYRAHIGGVAA
ncbi:TPA: ATP-binding protein [Escherichia coli]|nr:ATP-binding protein [Escherichia coli]